ncbi:MAG: GntR family transcriptional regulator, partial [Lentisphaerae bacterium]
MNEKKRRRRKAFVATYIYDSLRQRIEGGQYSVGSRLPSEHTLCDEFGASRMTVRSALKRLGEDGLIESQPGKGWCIIRNHALSGLKVKGPILLGAVNHGACLPAMRVAGEYLQRKGVSSRIHHLPLEPDLLNPEEHIWGGMIIFSGLSLAPQIVEFCKSNQIPLLSLMYVQRAEYDTVAPDQFTGTTEILEQLAAKGHRRIGYLSARDVEHGRDPSFRIRQAAYNLFMSSMNEVPRVFLTQYHYAFSQEDGHRFVEWLRKEKIDAVFCTTSVMIEFSLVQMAQHGIRATDIEICGASFDVPHILLEHHGLKSILAVDVDANELGETGARKI